MPNKGLPASEKLGLPPVAVPAGWHIGAHMSIAGGTPLALERALAVGCTAVQLFVKNNNRWEGKAISDAEAEEFRQRRSELAMPAVAHNGYLINMASADDTQWQRSIAAMLDEIERCALLGVPLLVAHPGAHLSAGEEAGLDRIATALREVADRTQGRDVRVLLEGTAGQGSTLGHKFEHLAYLLEKTDRPARLGVCLDTAHLIAAGFDLRTPEAVEATLASFDRIVGLAHLHAWHLNDSAKPLGSRVDRHAAIGEGSIGREGFRALLAHPSTQRLPLLLETPKGDKGELDWQNVRTLVELLPR